MNKLYIGLMSGTSADGIDAALVDFSDTHPQLLATHYTKFTPEIRRYILDLCQPGDNEINRLGELDAELGKEFAITANTLLKQNQLNKEQVCAIGSHGQTIRHHPKRNFTLQIGDPNIIASETGITTVADFRRRDIALGGQGAPLVPAFHAAIFRSPTVNRIVVNIGGMANITLLPADDSQPIHGFDTGPGNTLLDAWIEKHLHEPRDTDGNWARQGQIDNDLLQALLKDPFFSLKAPKSTGREYFNLEWLEKQLPTSIKPIDVQATLVELTAQSIIAAIKQYCSSGEIILCGGGAHNTFLMEQLRKAGSHYSIESTQKFGISPDWIEAMAFAWLAKQTLAKQSGNIKTVTGAKEASILGGVYFV